LLDFYRSKNGVVSFAKQLLIIHSLLFCTFQNLSPTEKAVFEEKSKIYNERFHMNLEKKKDADSSPNLYKMLPREDEDQYFV